MTTTVEVEPKYDKWLRSHDTGMSSKTMFSAITGIPTGEREHPHDIADVGRCVRMLRFLPELRSKIHMVSDKYPEWIPFIDCWKELERGYDECMKFEALPDEEQKRMKRKKHFVSPNERYWNVMLQLTCASRYLRGWRCQNTVHSWSTFPPKEV